MRKLFRTVLIAGSALVLLSVVTLFLLFGRADRITSDRLEMHTASFPIPYPVDAAEVEARGWTPAEAEAIAAERAVERGRHLVQARYGCVDCHGEDFGGGLMMEAGPVGTFYGPNLTTGTGGRTGDFNPPDWDRIVRHGVMPDGRRSVMPAVDFHRMSDQELSDVITYIRSVPPVDRTMPAGGWGPLGKVLVATGRMPFSADAVGQAIDRHTALPPSPEVSAEFGAHLATTCMGCHGMGYTGGPIPGAPPEWAEAANLTPHETGLAGWTYEDFQRAVRDGRRPDGTELRIPMTFILPTVARMTDTEMQAMWSYLSSLPPTPRTGP